MLRMVTEMHIDKWCTIIGTFKHVIIKKQQHICNLIVFYIFHYSTAEQFVTVFMLNPDTLLKLLYSLHSSYTFKCIFCVFSFFLGELHTWGLFLFFL